MSKVLPTSGLCASLLPLLAALFPISAIAQSPDYPANVWAEEFRTVDQIPGGTTGFLNLVNVTGNPQGASGQARGAELPFPFSFFGSGPYEKFNVGAKGYITFGEETAGAHDSSKATPDLLLRDEAPWNLIAAWWGDHYCSPEGGIKTKLLGDAPTRTFIIEFEGCSKRQTTTAGTATTFQAQIWLSEGSDVVRIKYGGVNLDRNQPWPAVAWGLKPPVGAGWLGPNAAGGAAGCTPTSGQPTTCSATNFPSNSVIQYGLSEEADVSARIEQRLQRVHPTEVEIDVDATLLNVGKRAIDGVGLELYLATSPLVAPGEAGSWLVGTHPPQERLSAGESRALRIPVRANRPPNGLYRMCALIDPEGTLAEQDRRNNWGCSHGEISIGPDLTGTITAPADGEPGASRMVRFSVRNEGNDRAPTFRYRVYMSPHSAGAGLPRERLYVGEVQGGLAAGASTTLDRILEFPKVIRAASYTFDLEIDFDEQVDDADRSNNVVSSEPMANNRPQLKIGLPLIHFELDDGCFYGERIHATFEICNIGKAEAVGFRPGIIMGDEQVNAAFDVPAASSPNYCGVRGTWNYRACEAVAGRGASCAFEHCRVRCTATSECSAGMRCEDDPLLGQHLGISGVKSCMNVLPAESASTGRQHCRSYTVSGVLPFEDQVGQPYTAEKKRFHVIDDVLHSLSQEAPDVFTTEEFECRTALLDLAATELRPVTELVVGKELPIARVIENKGFINLEPGVFTRPESARFRYQYFLSSVPEVSIFQIPLPDRSTGGAGQETITRKGKREGVDVVTIPPDVLPGEYYLGVILDPDGEWEELDKRNNVYVYPEAVRVHPPGLEIISRTLPTANLGASYRHQLVAKGALGTEVWSARNLPPGMQLSEEGRLHGIPSDVGVFAFTVKLQAGGAKTERMFALQILRGQSELEVGTETLPIAVKGQEYGRYYDPLTQSYQQGVRLSARGGLPPLRWELDPSEQDHRLPQGLEGPTKEGVILGQPTPMSETSSFWVQVTDALGNQARRLLEIEVVEAGTLTVPGRPFPLATSGRNYDACIEAQGGDGAYDWQVDERSLPPGLRPEGRDARICLMGTPTACGDYSVRVLVMDGQGQSSTSSISLTVNCGVIQLNSRAVRPVRRGEEVEFELRANPSQQPSFRIIRGALPKGLSLSLAGMIEGIVADDASFEPHDVIIELSDVEGRRSLSALTMSVIVEAKPRLRKSSKPDGCSSAGGGPAGLVWLGLLLGRGRRALAWGRRRGVRASARSGRPLAGGGTGVAMAPARSGRPLAGGGTGGAMAPARSGRPLAGGGTGGAMAPARSSPLRLPALFSFVFALGLAAAACGGGTVIHTDTRCSESSCGENFVCDETDGLCKCGGVAICAEGEGCALSPSPHCVSELCSFTECTGGQSCHPETGLCQCGGVPCGEDERCVAEVCVRSDLCEDVVCGQGLDCDPQDGACRCDGEICETGDICVDGSCTADPCSGVSCGAHSVCNPDDGLCHCGEEGGSICNTGEACLEEGGTYFCRISTLCDHAECVGGTVCDPDDGQCRCGGVGLRAPICEEGKICVDGACRGGDLCAPGGVETVCPLGSTCDPTDGACKCGGMFGEFCGEGEGCTFLAGAFSCTPLCTLLAFPPTCPSGQSCYFDLDQSHGRSFCAAVGKAELGDDCDAANDCLPGLHCSQAKKCTRVCEEDSEPEFCQSIAPDLQCTPFRFGDLYGYCRAP